MVNLGLGTSQNLVDMTIWEHDMSSADMTDPLVRSCQSHRSGSGNMSDPQWVRHNVTDETGKVTGTHLFHLECLKEKMVENGGFCPRCPKKRGEINLGSFLDEREVEKLKFKISDYPKERKSYIEKQRSTVLNGIKKLSYFSMPIIPMANYFGRENIGTSVAVATLASGLLGYLLTKNESNEEKRSIKYGIAFRHGISLPWASARNAMLIAGIASILSNMWQPKTPVLSEAIFSLGVGFVLKDVYKAVYAIKNKALSR